MVLIHVSDLLGEGERRMGVNGSGVNGSGVNGSSVNGNGPGVNGALRDLFGEDQWRLV